MAIIPVLIFLWVLSLAIAIFAFWVWMLVDCLQKEPSQGNEKIIWVVIILLTHLLGAILYYCIRRPERIKEFGE